ncbi:hypothetical protein VTK56DRAFT_3683 [Thermocarpiscus australiensis]
MRHGLPSAEGERGRVLAALVERRIKKLRSFDQIMRRYGDFCVFDIFTVNGRNETRLYRLGSSRERASSPRRRRTGMMETISAIESEITGPRSYPQQPSEESEGQGEAFQRIIFCQGLSRTQPHLDHLSPLPYLVLSRKGNPIKRAITLHLECTRRVVGQSGNPYRDASTGFHITFYELVNTFLLYPYEEHWKKTERWKVGYMYGKSGLSGPTYDVFRQSAFTMCTMSGGLQNASGRDRHQDQAFDPYWTILLLTPSGFFRHPYDPEGPHAYEGEDGKFIINWRSEDPLARGAAELTIICHALEAVVEKWNALHEYIAGLLVDNFMEPKQYVELLYDDQYLTRSRLYFWIIGCVNEFLISIEDNINQWKLFKEARVAPVLAMESTELAQRQQLLSLAADTDNACATLESLKTKFQNQLDTTKTRREGLFNASALIESRSSTRLAENVRLLTYVSIFYLPLAFCAALWAIPNINDHGTRTAFIIAAVIVSVVTHIAVSNLGNISALFGWLHRKWRDNMVNRMKSDESWEWRRLAWKLEGIESRNESAVPSDWNIAWYQLRVWQSTNSSSGSSPPAADPRDGSWSSAPASRRSGGAVHLHSPLAMRYLDGPRALGPRLRPLGGRPGRATSASTRTGTGRAAGGGCGMARRRCAARPACTIFVRAMVRRVRMLPEEGRVSLRYGIQVTRIEEVVGEEHGEGGVRGLFLLTRVAWWRRPRRMETI